MIAERGRTGASFLIDADRYQVLVMTPMAIDALAADSLIAKATKGCQRALSLSDAQVEYTRAIDPWAAFDSAAFARPLIAIAVFPKEQRRFDCHAGDLARFAAMSRGALYGRFDAPVPKDQVAMVEFRRDGLLEFAPLQGRAKVTKVSQTELLDDGTEHVRVWVDPEAFAPDVEGAVPRLELHVYNPVDPEPDILPLPERLIRAVWQQMLPWQARRLDVADDAHTVPALHFPAPRDSVLRVAYAAYERGALGTAASEAMTRLMFRPRPPQADIRHAMLQAATAFSMRDRHAEARSLMTDIMEVYPCLTLAPEAPQELRDMAEDARRPARCSSIPLPVVALRSLVPGLGQATGPVRRKLALGVFAGTAASYGLASVFESRSRRFYRDYRAYQGGDSEGSDAPSLYQQAQSAREIGNAFMIAAATVWIAGGVEAVWNEYQHKRRLAEVRAVGNTPPRAAGVSFAPMVRLDRVGVTLQLP